MTGTNDDGVRVLFKVSWEPGEEGQTASVWSRERKLPEGGNCQSETKEK